MSPGPVPIVLVPIMNVANVSTAVCVTLKPIGLIIDIAFVISSEVLIAEDV
jgi:hypothetical protein